MFSNSAEETFRIKPKKPIEIEKIEEPKLHSIIERLEGIEKQIDMISKYLSNVSQRVSKTIETSVLFQKDLDNLEKRIESIRLKIEDLESVVPEVELERKFGKGAR